MLQLNPNENRRSIREIFKIPVKLEVVESEKSSAKIFLGYTANISAHGIGLSLPSETLFRRGAEIIVNIDGDTALQTTRVPAKVLWQANSQTGLEFLEELEDLKSIVSRTSPSLAVQFPFLRKFYPYVEGEDIDTKKYEFSPYADKFISDFRKTRDYMIQLKNGESPPGVEQFFFAQYAVADSHINEMAILSAHKAFQDFKKISIQRRRKILDDVREMLYKEKNNIIDLLIMEGHPRKLAEWEYSGMLVCISKESLDYFEQQMMQTLGHFGDETIITVRRPHGVICVSPPKNASSVAFMSCLSLLAGNTLVIKPPLQMPVSSLYMWRNIFGTALKMNGAPKGTINVVIGNSREFMEQWLESPYVKCIFFFGESDAGLDLGRRIYEKGKKPILELSGNDHLVAWKDAPLNEAADSLLDAFMGSTQICMVPKKALIHESIYHQFAKLFVEKANCLKVGLPSDPDTILSPVTKIALFYDHLNEAIENGAELLTGGYRINHRGERDADGTYIAPTVISVPLERAGMLRCMTEENFFPLLPLVKVTGRGLTEREKDHSIFDEMIRILNNNQYGLRISVWARNSYYQRKFIDEVDHSGLLRINSRHINFTHMLSTNGGTGKSGGPFGEMNHVWLKTSHLQGISITKLNTDNQLLPQINAIIKEE